MSRRIRRLARLASELQNVAVDIESELAVVQRVLLADASGRLDAAIECAVALGREARLREQLRVAAVGATRLEMRRRANGAVMARIDEGKWFRLSRGDARLLALLARVPVAEDGFPGWKSYDQLQDQIGQETGVRPTRRAMIESIYRIRKALKEADLNQYLLQGKARPGRVRFLLRVPVRDAAAPRQIAKA